MQKNLEKLAKKKADIAAEIRALKRAQKRMEMEARRREIEVIVERAIRGGVTIEQVSSALAQIGTHSALKAEPQLAP
jgi:hypothetical protein